MKGKWKTIAVVAAGLVLVVVIFIAGRGSRQDLTAVAGYEKTTAEIGDLAVQVEGDGIVSAPFRTQVNSSISGTIKSLTVTEGDYVKEGDALVLLEDPSLDLQVKQHQTTVNSLQQQIQQLDNEIDNLYLPAPVSGRVIEWKVEPGDRTILQQTAAVLETAVLQALFLAEEETVGLIVPGMEVECAGTENEVLSGTVTEKQSLPTGQVTLLVQFPFSLEEELPSQLFLNIDETQLQADSPERRRVEISCPETVQLVSSLAVKEGDTVSAGDPLIYYSTAALESQRENLILQLESARISRDRAKMQIENLTIKASQNGVVINLTAKKGGMVSPSQPLMVLVDYSRLQVSARIDELDLPQIQLNQTVQIYSAAATGKAFSGKVIEIAEEGLPQGGVTTFEITTSLEKTEMLKPGMNVQIKIAVAEKEGVLLVPIEALQEKDGIYYVGFPPAAGETEPVMQEIETGLYNAAYIEVTAGLNAGDTILVPAEENSGGFGPFSRGN